MRDYDFYLDKAKELNGFKYDNQIDAALGFKAAMACQLRKGKTHLSDDKMFALSKLAGENPLIALVDLNFMRANGEAKKSYKRMSVKLSKALQMVMISWVLAMLPSVAHAGGEMMILTSFGGNIALTTLFIITHFIRAPKFITNQNQKFSLPYFSYLYKVPTHLC